MQPDTATASFPWPSLALFPERLNYALERAQLTPGELAREINASRKVISNLRTRANRVYGGPYLQAMAGALEAPPDWLGSNTAPGEVAARLRRERHDAVDDLAAVVTRLLEKGIMSQSEIVALTSMMRIRENEAKRVENHAIEPERAPVPIATADRAAARAVIWPQPVVARLMAAVGAAPVADAA